MARVKADRSSFGPQIKDADRPNYVWRRRRWNGRHLVPGLEIGQVLKAVLATAKTGKAISLDIDPAHRHSVYSRVHYAVTYRAAFKGLRLHGANTRKDSDGTQPLLLWVTDANREDEVP